MNRKQRRASKSSEPASAMLLSQRLEAVLGAQAPRSSLKPLAWQSAMRRLWEQAEEAKREAL